MEAFVALAQKCAPQVQVEILAAVASIESGLNPLAIRINTGLPLARQPTTKASAIAAATALINDGHDIDLGLGGINAAVLRRLDISIAQALEPCSNLKATGRLLESYYRGAIESGAAPAEAARLTLASYYGNGDPEVGTLARYPQRVAAVRRTLASDLSTLRVKDPSALGGNPLPQRPLTEGLAALDQPASRQAPTTAAPASLPEPEPLSPTIPPSGPRWDVFGNARHSTLLVFGSGDN